MGQLQLVAFGIMAFATAAAAQFAPPALAASQDTAGLSKPANDELRSEHEGLEQIVVTAQRREENLQKAAISITAVTGDSLVRAGVTDTSQLTNVVPALQIGTLGGPIAQLYVRGVGKFAANSLSDGAIAVNIDGVPLARDGAIQGLFYDLERVEVLKGPQGTLYGRNATGGAINLISVQPRAGELSGYLNGEYGNFDAHKFTGAINIPAGKNSAFRIAGIVSDHDGYYSDGTGDEKMRAVRVLGSSQLNDSFKITFGGDYAYFGGIGTGATVNGLDRDDRIGLLDTRAGVIYSQTLSPLAGTFLNPVSNEPFNDNHYWGVHVQADLETAIGTLTLLPSYRNVDVRYSTHSPSFPLNDRLKDEQATIEARLASDGSNRFDYIVGTFFLDENARQRPTYAQQYFNVHAQFLTDTTSYAGFTRLTYKVTDEFRLSGGLRYTVDEKSGLLDAYNLVVVCLDPSHLCPGTPPLPNTFDLPPGFALPNGDPIPFQPWGTSGAAVVNSRPVIRPSETFKKATYRLGVEYDVGPQSLLYASYETGFKSGGFFHSIDNPVYKPETIDAITVGSKNRFLGNALQLNAEAFWWTYKDKQVSHYRINSEGGNEFVTENVGRTRIRGIEVEALALVGQGTMLNATVQFLNATDRDFVFTNPASVGPPNIGCPFQLTGGEYRINCSGRPAVNAPKWTINGGIEQAFGLKNGGRLTFNADGHYQTWAYTGFEQLPGMLQESYFTLDLQMQYAFPGDSLKISGFANNVTDKNVAGFSTPHPFGPSLIVESLRPPRTYGVRLGYSF